VAALSLAGKNQNAIAVTLGISQSAVSQRLAVAQWWAVAAALERWDDLCKDTFAKT
jgi:predicted transcriptional regulator